jgi:hypothetical protein
LHEIRKRSDARGGEIFETLPDARFALDIPGMLHTPGQLPPTPIYGRAPDATPQKPKVAP